MYITETIVLATWSGRSRVTHWAHTTTTSCPCQPTCWTLCLLFFSHRTACFSSPPAGTYCGGAASTSYHSPSHFARHFCPLSHSHNYTFRGARKHGSQATGQLHTRDRCVGVVGGCIVWCVWMLEWCVWWMWCVGVCKYKVVEV